MASVRLKLQAIQLAGYRKILVLMNKIVITLPIRLRYPLEHLYSFRSIRHSFSSRLKTVTEVQGNVMFLDPIDTLNLSVTGVYEPLETEVMRREVKAGSVVLDLGANIGYYTLIMAKMVGKKGKIFAFEPEPNNFDLLKRNVLVNGYRNVQLVQKAVSNITGNANLYLSESDKGDNRIYDSKDCRSHVEIQVTRLDDYFENYSEKISLIKIDTQGAEPGVIDGMSLLLKKNPNVKIITEFWPLGLKKFGVNPEEYLRLLTVLGFKLFNIDEAKYAIESLSVAELLNAYTVEKRNYTNLLCLRN